MGKNKQFPKELTERDKLLKILSVQEIDYLDSLIESRAPLTDLGFNKYNREFYNRFTQRHETEERQSYWAFKGYSLSGINLVRPDCKIHRPWGDDDLNDIKLPKLRKIIDKMKDPEITYQENQNKEFDPDFIERVQRFREYEEAEKELNQGT